MGLINELLLGFTLVACMSKCNTIFAAGIRGNYSIACFVGVGKARLEDLTKIEMCPHGSICYFKYYLNELLESVIDAGCRSKKDCKTAECAENFYKDPIPENETIVRARKDLVLCDECCYTGLCNKQGCGLVLNLDQIARRCFGECTGVKGMEHCLSWVECESENYMCTTSLPIGASVEYTLGCQRREMCELLMTVSERDKCCDSDLCNVIPHFENIFHGNETDDVKCPKNLIPTTKRSTHSLTTIASTQSQTAITNAQSPIAIRSTQLPTTITSAQSSITVTSTQSPTTIISTQSPTTITSIQSPTTITSTRLPTTITGTQSSTTTTSTQSPTTVTSTQSPTTITSTRLPTTITSTQSPTTITRSQSPTTITSTQSPTTIISTLSPTTITSTLSPTTITSTLSPTTITSTRSTTTITSTQKSTPLTSTQSPTTIISTRSPITTTTTTDAVTIAPAASGTPSKFDTTTTTLTSIPIVPSRRPPITLPPEQHTCFTCGDSAPDLCEYQYQETQCDPPNNYCMNIVTNTVSGARTLERKCTSFDDCYSNWWQGSSDEELCQTYNPSKSLTADFQCSFCCIENKCNEDIKPPKPTLYQDN